MLVVKGQACCEGPSLGGGEIQFYIAWVQAKFKQSKPHGVKILKKNISK